MSELIETTIRLFPSHELCQITFGLDAAGKSKRCSRPGYVRVVPNIAHRSGGNFPTFCRRCFAEYRKSLAETGRG